MGIAGVSVLLASGDNGVGCNADGTSQEFDYPSSPYITMVGATYIDAATKQEVGATLSSGGFSLDFYQADWQADAVNAYFASNPILPTESYFKYGRAYPDIAGFGQNVQVVAAGKSTAVSGTSCSAPIVAGVIALLNDELLAAGIHVHVRLYSCSNCRSLVSFILLLLHRSFFFRFTFIFYF
jgi:tripeptidyl-peptidase-1